MGIQLDGYKVSRTQTLEDIDTSLSTSLGATVDQAFIENPSSSLVRYGELERQTRGDFVPGSKGAEFTGPTSAMVSQKDADIRIKENGVSLKIGALGVPEDALNTLISRKREEVKRRAVIDSAPEGFWSGAAEIGTGLAVSIADPLNIASAFVPVFGQARYARLLANASGAGGRAGVRAGVGAVEGVVGAAIVEPIVLGAAEAEQSEYGLYNSFLNLTFGAVLGGGLHTSVGAIGDVIGRSSASTRQDLLTAATAQALDGQPIDIGYIARADSSFSPDIPDIKVDIVDTILEGGYTTVSYKTSNGEMTANIAGESIIVSHSLIKEAGARGKGEGVALYSALIRDAKKRGLNTIVSDTDVSPDAARVWASLERRGLDVERNHTARLVKEDGRSYWTVDDDQRSVFSADIEDLHLDGFPSSPPARPTEPQSIDSIVSVDGSTFRASSESETGAIDIETNDILTALDDVGEDTAVVRAEIDEINQTADREAAGLREALLCAIGR